MGTPEFAVESLKALMDAGHDIAAVVTMPDKPAGRGQKTSQSAVKTFAVEHGLKVLQPEKLKDPAFVDELRSLGADLQVVVAFRMLPEIVWNMPRYGSVNLHASLLPQYRGAAPINWAIINGETQTGVTTFRLKHEIDTGDIMMQRSIDILPDDNAGTIHDKLMTIGGEMIAETVRRIEAGEIETVSQDMTDDGRLRTAPKIFKADCRIDWTRTAEQIRNLVRGLSPYPAAWSTLHDAKGNELAVKIFATETDTTRIDCGRIETDGKTYLRVGCADGSIAIREIQLSGKKRMVVRQFLQGFHFADNAKFD